MKAKFMRYTIFLSMFILTSCTAIPPYALTDWAIIGLTEKTVEDHVVSFASGKNCSTVRTDQGRTYCVEDEKNPEPKGHCYRTIGEVTCYDRPDPHANGHQKVDEVEYNLLGRSNAERHIPNR